MTQPRDTDHPTVVIAAEIFPAPGRIIEEYGSACTIAFADLSSAEAIAAGAGRGDAVVVPAERLGCGVVTQPASGALEVATHAVGLMIALYRKFTVADSYVRAGWAGPL